MVEPVLFEIHGRVANLTLNRPAQLNAINLEMRDLLWTYLEAAQDTPDVEVIIFRGEGRAFSAGADISEFGTSPSIFEARKARHGRPVWELLLSHRCTTIAALHGFCYGAGLELPLCCDIRIAAEGALFGLPEVTLGYIPSAGGTQTLARTIPPGIAAQMILSGEPIDSKAAQRWGLVESIVAPSDLEHTVERRSAKILQLSPDRRPRSRPEFHAFPPLHS
ncbi:MAG TPA: enoyl-CoA hydratase/isomerase family protein [Dehalococcoidia bacterium]|nr:enoyl-CoA hydratase/isomerase family protein [Dehalococcoidia bacterium]